MRQPFNVSELANFSSMSNKFYNPQKELKNLLSDLNKFNLSDNVKNNLYPEVYRIQDKLKEFKNEKILQDNVFLIFQFISIHRSIVNIIRKKVAQKGFFKKGFNKSDKSIQGEVLELLKELIIKTTEMCHIINGILLGKISPEELNDNIKNITGDNEFDLLQINKVLTTTQKVSLEDLSDEEKIKKIQEEILSESGEDTDEQQEEIIIDIDEVESKSDNN